MTRKTDFWGGWSWLKFNNLGLALGRNLKFYTSLSKGLKLKVRKFWEPILTFAEVTEETLVGGRRFALPLPPHLNRVERQKLKSSNHELVGRAIFNWFLSMRRQNVPLSASMIQEKAAIFTKELNTIEERNNISFKTVSGESKPVTPEMVNAWSETSLPTLLSNYDMKDIYNAEEFGLFYQCFPNKTCQLKSQKCYGGKLSRIRITGMEAANAMVDMLPVFVIYQVAFPTI